jgi:type IV secretory pathway component VirB8
MFSSKKKTATGDAPKPKSKTEQLHEQALSWETSRVKEVEKSERRAWMIAGTATFVAALMGVGTALMLPLKENTPYLIRVDNATGIPDIITALDTTDVAFDEVMDTYWLAQFVKARETYDWYTIQKDYDTVGLLASPGVGAEYATLFEGKDDIQKIYGRQFRVTVDVVSVVPNGRGVGTVRFTKTVKRTDDVNSAGDVTRWVATIGYEYRNPSRLRASSRLVNPFGFQVRSYRVDPEMGVGQ